MFMSFTQNYLRPITARRSQRGPKSSLRLNSLETREVPATITVTTIADNTTVDGKVSLREALTSANNNANLNVDVLAIGAYGTDDIVFDATVFATPQAITLTKGELPINGAVTVTGPASKVTLSGNHTSRIFNTSEAPAGTAIGISHLTITAGNDGLGGAIVGLDEAITLTSCVLTSNTGVIGGAVHISAGGALTAIDTTFSNNEAIWNIGAISVYGGTGSKTVLRRCTVSNNNADGGVGGVYATGYLLIENSTVSGNTARGNVISASTGGIYAAGPFALGSLVIRNSTISGNTAKQDGGGITLAKVSGTLVVQNSTITVNTSESAVGAGGIFRPNGSGLISLESSIVSNNTHATAPDIFSNVKVEYEHCSISSLNGIAIPSDLGGNRPIGEDPRLGSLQNNGGPTQTHGLLPDSPAINAGSDAAGLAFDQRGVGFARIVNGLVDIGAFEAQGAPAKVSAFQVNDGSAQRSRVTSLTVAFDAPVTLPANAADAFSLTGAVGSVQLTVGSVVGNSVMLTFSGAGTEFGSLADGRYTLTAFASKINNGNFDGNADGTPGDDYVLVGSPANGLFRLFGDADGNGTVNTADFNALRTAFGGSSFIFDFNNTGSVDTADFNHFRARFGASV